LCIDWSGFLFWQEFFEQISKMIGEFVHNFDLFESRLYANRYSENLRSPCYEANVDAARLNARHEQFRVFRASLNAASRSECLVLSRY